MKEYYVVPEYFVTYYGEVEMYVPYGTPFGYGTHYDFSDSGETDGWKDFSLFYITLPLHFQYKIHKEIFVLAGIETSWLINYKAGNDKTEFNWTIGFGNQQHKLKWSVNYIRGFKDVAFANKLWALSDGSSSTTGYRNNMLQLSLSYPLWQKK